MLLTRNVIISFMMAHFLFASQFIYFFLLPFHNCLHVYHAMKIQFVRKWMEQQQSYEVKCISKSWYLLLKLISIFENSMLCYLCVDPIIDWTMFLAMFIGFYIFKRIYIMGHFKSLDELLNCHSHSILSILTPKSFLLHTNTHNFLQPWSSRKQQPKPWKICKWLNHSAVIRLYQYHGIQSTVAVNHNQQSTCKFNEIFFSSCTTLTYPKEDKLIFIACQHKTLVHNKRISLIVNHMPNCMSSCRNMGVCEYMEKIFKWKRKLHISQFD